MTTEWDKVQETADFLNEQLGPPPDVWLVLGSGLGTVGSQLQGEKSVAFDAIPNWPESTVAGHRGIIRRGILGNMEVALQLGRIHLYEGHHPGEVVRAVRAGICWGAKTVIITNAAGGINEMFKAGDLMMIEDHINLTSNNPLIGPNNDEMGPRFPDMSEVYSREIRAIALDEATGLGLNLRTGVYAGVLGPSYETPAEIAMLRGYGADAVGMSTVLEAIAARHMGAQVAGISCITNPAASVKGPKLSHDEVQLFAAKAADDMTRLLSALLGRVKQNDR